MCSTCYSSVTTRKALRDSTNGNDTERNKSYTSNIVGKAFRYRTNGNDTERNKSYTSNIVGTGEVGRMGSVHSFLTLTSVRISGFQSSSPFINFRHGPKDEKWQKPIRNVMLWYMLWFNFILGSNVIFLCVKLIFIHNHTPKQR